MVKTLKNAVFGTTNALYGLAEIRRIRRFFLTFAGVFAIMVFRDEGATNGGWLFFKNAWNSLT
jgi:hypothetical protein